MRIHGKFLHARWSIYNSNQMQDDLHGLLIHVKLQRLAIPVSYF